MASNKPYKPAPRSTHAGNILEHRYITRHSPTAWRVRIQRAELQVYKCFSFGRALANAGAPAVDLALDTLREAINYRNGMIARVDPFEAAWLAATETINLDLLIAELERVLVEPPPPNVAHPNVERARQDVAAVLRAYAPRRGLYTYDTVVA